LFKFWKCSSTCSCGYCTRMRLRTTIIPVLKYFTYTNAPAVRRQRHCANFSVACRTPRLCRVCSLILPYQDETLGVPLLSDRRRQQCEPLFKQIVRDKSHVLHYLLPTKRDSQLTDRVRSATILRSFHVRTTSFQNAFIPFAITKAAVPC